jgi:hypothetical protein
VIYVCIRSLGRCPCPRCLVEITDVHNMGKTADLQIRTTNVRVDDQDRRKKIEKARRLVYAKGSSVNGPTVKRALELETMIPTRVRIVYLTHRLLYSYHCRMPFQPNSLLLASTISCSTWSICCMNSNWEFGKTHLFICCECCMHMAVRQYRH